MSLFDGVLVLLAAIVVGLLLRELRIYRLERRADDEDDTNLFL